MNPSLRQIPPVHALLDAPAGRALLAQYPRPMVLTAVRAGLDDVRRQLRGNGAQPHPFLPDEFFAAVRRDLEDRDRSRLQRVINATGIIIHTNMGRAPLAAEAVEAVRRSRPGTPIWKWTWGPASAAGGAGRSRSCYAR